MKYDYEVVPTGTSFNFEIMLEDPEGNDLGLFMAAFREFENGYVYVGGNRSRGSGKCRIKERQVKIIDYTNPASLSTYLITKKAGGLRKVDIEALFEKNILEAGEIRRRVPCRKNC